jgi:hypothetical protein
MQNKDKFEINHGYVFLPLLILTVRCSPSAVVIDIPSTNAEL